MSVLSALPGAGVAKLLRYVWNHPLNRDDPAAAVGRVLRWQVASRLIDGYIAFPFVEDTHLVARRGMVGATGNWYCGLHEVDEMAFVLHMLRPDDHFVDVGANVGSYTVLAAGACGARVTCVEPIPSTFVHLQRNVRFNELQDRVRCCGVGLSERSGTLRFSTDQQTINHVLAEGEGGPSLDVPVTTLDELLDGDVPRVLKIDVEGHEAAVLAGAGQTLAAPELAAVLMETNGSGDRYGVADEQLLSTMRSAGFEPYGYDPLGRRLLPFDPAMLNTVFVRSADEVGQRVRASRRFRTLQGSI